MGMISVVTAFFDIGRGEWLEKVPNLQPYLHRTNQTYLDRFARLAVLENDMTVFTSEEFAPEVRRIRQQASPGSRTRVFTMDFQACLGTTRGRIAAVQCDEQWRSQIFPGFLHNPEYWNADYVLVNALKSRFARMALEMEAVDQDLVAWLDFGYCREEATLGACRRWSHPFDPEKMHLFSIMEYDGASHHDVISNNRTYVTGPCIVGGHQPWRRMDALFTEIMSGLLDEGWIDDDQSILLFSSLRDPETFRLHRLNQWFSEVREFNADTR